MKVKIILIMIALMSYSQSLGEWKNVYEFNDFLRFRDMDCADELNCMSISFDHIIKTTDGGNSWFIQLTDTSIKVYNESGQIEKVIPPKFKPRMCIDYVTPDFAVMGHQTGQVSITRDGGTTWDSVSLGLTREIKSIQFIDEKYGIVFALDSDIFRTYNGGHNWEKIELKYKDKYPTSEVNISVVGKDSLVVLVLDNSNDTIPSYRTESTTDGGLTWESGNLIPSDEELYPYFISMKQGWLTGGDRIGMSSFKSVILCTTDGGKSWNNQMDTLLNPPTGFSKIYFYDENEGIAYDLRKIFRTSNGGQSWEIDDTNPIPSQKNELIQKLVFPKGHTKKIFANTLVYGQIWMYDDLTSVNENEINIERMNIFPNPTTDFITITLDRLTPLSKLSPSNKVQTFDMLGIEVYTAQTGISELLKIDVSHLPAGVYFIRVGNKVEKFVKM